MRAVGSRMSTSDGPTTTTVVVVIVVVARDGHPHGTPPLSSLAALYRWRHLGLEAQLGFAMLFRASALLLLGQAAVDAYSLGAAVRPSTRAATGVRMSSVSRRALGEAAAAAAVVLTPLAASAEGYPQLSMKTTEGEMQFELWDDVAPKHVASFLKLTKEGFFDGCSFHRIIPVGAALHRPCPGSLAARTHSASAELSSASACSIASSGRDLTSVLTDCALARLPPVSICAGFCDPGR